MQVVSDTSPISHLVLISEAGVLPELYGKILIPRAVWSELSSPEGPELLQKWTRQPPGWLEVKAVRGSGKEGKDLADLDAGEREAILLAKQIGAGLVILDERAGRQVAKGRGLILTGTIGVLGAAVERGLVEAADAVERLRQTSFRASPDLYRWLLSRQQ